MLGCPIEPTKRCRRRSARVARPYNVDTASARIWLYRLATDSVWKIPTGPISFSGPAAVRPTRAMRISSTTTRRRTERPPEGRASGRPAGLRPTRRALPPGARSTAIGCSGLDTTPKTWCRSHLRAWRNLGSYEPRAPLSSWLYRIATNASLDEIERRPRRPQPVEPYPDKPLAESDALTYDPVARFHSARDWNSGC